MLYYESYVDPTRCMPGHMLRLWFCGDVQPILGLLLLSANIIQVTLGLEPTYIPFRIALALQYVICPTWMPAHLAHTLLLSVLSTLYMLYSGMLSNVLSSPSKLALAPE